MQLNGYHAPNADTAAIVTIPAIADGYHVIDSIDAGFDSAPAAAKKLNVTFGGVEKWAIDIPANIGACKPPPFTFPRGLYTGTDNEEVIVTLAADNGGAKGKVAVGYR